MSRALVRLSGWLSSHCHGWLPSGRDPPAGGRGRGGHERRDEGGPQRKGHEEQGGPGPVEGGSDAGQASPVARAGQRRSAPWPARQPG